jgi:hypothetical protein
MLRHVGLYAKKIVKKWERTNPSGRWLHLLYGTTFLTMLYYPPSNRGPGLVFSSTLINAGGQLANALVQEFVLHKYTTNANK